jgi:hypothetical protein
MLKATTKQAWRSINRYVRLIRMLWLWALNTLAYYRLLQALGMGYPP